MTRRGTMGRARRAPLVLLALGSLVAAAAYRAVMPERAQAAEPAPSKRLPALEHRSGPAG